MFLIIVLLLGCVIITHPSTDSWFVNPAVVEQQNNMKAPTGYEFLEALNKYRVSEGLEPFELYEPLCNNIAERWQNYKDTNSHDGLQDFADKWIPDMKISEVLTFGETAEQMVDRLASSPSHNLMIRNNSRICTYSAEGYSVALLAR